MATGWIAIDKTLPFKAEISQIAKGLGISRAEVVLACILTWVWADEVSTDGGLGRFDLDDVDFAARQAGFGQAMMDVGWLAKADDGLFLPNYHVWNGTTAKARILKNRRMAEWRNAHEPSTAPSTAPSARPSTGESPK